MGRLVMSEEQQPPPGACCTCSPCCKPSNEDKTVGPPRYDSRSCTDCAFLLLFVLFWIGNAAVSIINIQNGDPDELLYGSDYMGNRCGVGEFKDKPKTYYPRMDADVREQKDLVATAPWKIKLYGLCVKECPS